MDGRVKNLISQELNLTKSYLHEFHTLNPSPVQRTDNLPDSLLWIHMYIIKMDSFVKTFC